MTYLKCFITTTRFKAFWIKGYRYNGFRQRFKEAQEGNSKSERQLRISGTWKIRKVIAGVKALTGEFSQGQ